MADIDPDVQPGNAGELHQQASAGHPRLTTQQGVPVGDDQNSLRAGARGPVLLEDFVLRERINHFDHERIPERVVHARGSAAHGWFELTDSLAHVCRADVFQRVGERTPLFARFSAVAGNAGSTDLPRDVRGFAVKFYMQEGNWDLVGNNIPVFFIQDAIKSPDLIHAVQQEPDRGFPQAASAHDTFWDYVSLTPESMHMIMWVMSDRGIPRSLRMMEGFGVHTFRLLSGEGRGTYVKFHWRPKLGTQSVVWDEAVKISGADSDYHRRDLCADGASTALADRAVDPEHFAGGLGDGVPAERCGAGLALRRASFARCHGPDGGGGAPGLARHEPAAPRRQHPGSGTSGTPDKTMHLAGQWDSHALVVLHVFAAVRHVAACRDGLPGRMIPPQDSLARLPAP